MAASYNFHDPNKDVSFGQEMALIFDRVFADKLKPITDSLARTFENLKGSVTNFTNGLKTSVVVNQQQQAGQGAANQSPAMKVIDTFTKSLNKLKPQSFKKLDEKVLNLTKDFAVASGKIGGGLLGGAARGTAAAAQGAGAAEVGGAVGAGAIGGAAIGGTVAAAAVASLAAFAVAAKVATDSLLGMVNTVAKFVGTYNPAAVNLFNQTIKDLTAVIGSALLPVLQAFTNLARFAADALLPIVTKLAPVFNEVATALIEYFAPIIVALANILAEAQPFIERFSAAIKQLASTMGQGLADILETLAPIAIELVAIFAELIAGIAPLFMAFEKLVANILKIGLKPLVFIIDWVVWLIGKLANGLAFGIEMINKVFDFFGRLFGREERKQVETMNSTGMAARQAQYMNVEELSKQLIAAAFGSSASIPQQQLNVQKAQLEVLQKIAANQRGPQGPKLQNQQAGIMRGP